MLFHILIFAQDSQGNASSQVCFLLLDNRDQHSVPVKFLIMFEFKAVVLIFGGMLRLKHFLVFLVIAPFSTNLAQSEWLRFKVFRAAPLREFHYHKPSKFTKQSGKINVAIESANGYVFQVNGIPASEFKCGEVIAPSRFKLVLIDESLGRTYTSQSGDYHNSVGIICLENGMYRLKVKGKIFGKDKIKVSIQATLQGKITSDKNYQTQQYESN